MFVELKVVLVLVSVVKTQLFLSTEISYDLKIHYGVGIEQQQVHPKQLSVALNRLRLYHNSTLHQYVQQSGTCLLCSGGISNFVQDSITSTSAHTVVHSQRDALMFPAVNSLLFLNFIFTLCFHCIQHFYMHFLQQVWINSTQLVTGVVVHNMH